MDEFCKIPGSFLFKSTNKPASNPLKHFFPFFTFKMKCHWTFPIYKVHHAVLTLTCVLLTSLTPCYFSSLVVWNGTGRKAKSSRTAVPLFPPDPVSIQPEVLLTPGCSLDGRAGKRHSRRHISRRGCHSRPELPPGRISRSGGRL